MIDKDRILEELASESVILQCGKHRYVAARKRNGHTVAIPPNTRGCADCWRVYFFTDIALTLPSKRQERIDELEAVIHHAVEYERTGKFGKGFELYSPKDSRFAVELHKDAADDDTGEDKKKIITGEENLN